LKQDIDCAGVTLYGIGTQIQPYNSSFDGQNYVIRNLKMGSPTSSWLGLFGATSVAMISNVKIINAEITGTNRLGILLGAAMGGATIINVHVQGKIIATAPYVGNIGGLVGDGWSAKIFGSSANVEVVVTCTNTSDDCNYDGVGGLVGNSQGRISDSWSNGTINATNYCNVGGLVGYQGSGYIYNSKSTATVIGTKNSTGGLVGSSSGTIRECYASGVVQGVNNTGGLVGQVSSNYGLVSQSYATGNVTGKLGTGGLIGQILLNPYVTQTYAVGLVTGVQIGGLIASEWRSDVQYVNMSYWNIETTNSKESIAGTGKNTAEMYLQDTYEGWNFDTVWAIYPGKSYPFLQSTP